MMPAVRFRGPDEWAEDNDAYYCPQRGETRDAASWLEMFIDVDPDRWYVVGHVLYIAPLGGRIVWETR